MLQGKTALVTGSTSGIGLAIATALAQQGARIMLNGLGEAGAIEKARADLAETTGVEVAFNGADMTRPDEIEGLVADTVARLGSVDILVNNAGVQHTASIEDFPVERWDTIIAVNLSSSFHTMRHAVPRMREAGWGRIINTASVHGLVASVQKSAYVAAKHGLVGMTKVVALENAGTGVTANCFCPGFTLTELIQPQIDARAEKFGGDQEAGVRDLLSEKQPSLQPVTVEQIGQFCVFLCSPAADQITGTAIPIDGGWTAQ